MKPLGSFELSLDLNRRSAAQSLSRFDRGLDRYYGLLELGEKYDIIKRVGNRYEFPSGEKVFEKALYKDPTRYYTKEVLDRLDVAAGLEFKYGNGQEPEVSEEDEPNEELQ